MLQVRSMARQFLYLALTLIVLVIAIIWLAS